MEYQPKPIVVTLLENGKCHNIGHFITAIWINSCMLTITISDSYYHCNEYLTSKSLIILIL